MDTQELKQRELKLINARNSFGAWQRDIPGDNALSELLSAFAGRMANIAGLKNPAQVRALEVELFAAEQLVPEIEAMFQRLQAEQSARQAAERHAADQAKAASMTPEQVLAAVESDGFFKLELGEHGRVLCRPKGLGDALRVAVQSHLGSIQELLRQRELFDIIG